MFLPPIVGITPRLQEVADLVRRFSSRDPLLYDTYEQLVKPKGYPLSLVAGPPFIVKPRMNKFAKSIPYPGTLSAIERQVKALRQETGDQVILIGWSLGAAEALATARRCPQDVAGVVGISPLLELPAAITHGFSVPVPDQLPDSVATLLIASGGDKDSPNLQKRIKGWEKPEKRRRTVVLTGPKGKGGPPHSFDHRALLVHRNGQQIEKKNPSYRAAFASQADEAMVNWIQELMGAQPQLTVVENEAAEVPP